MKKKLAATAPVTVAAATKPRRTQTDAQAAQSTTIAMLGKLWKSLDDQSKASWLSTAEQLHSHSSSAGTIGAQPKVSAYLTFISANTVLYAAGSPLLQTAPATPVVPPPIPPAMLTATLSPSGSLTLTLLTVDYPFNVLVYGAAPVPAGQNIYKKKGAFKLIGALSDISLTANLSDFYNAKFRGASGGSKIAIKLVGVSPSGTRSAEMFVSCVTAAAASAADTGTDTQGALKIA